MTREGLLITGINGFVGRGLAAALQGSGRLVKVTIRSAEGNKGLVETGARVFVTGEIDERTDWGEALDGIDAVVHLAARVHVMNDLADDPLAEFRKVNTAGTLALAKQAATAGVKRFIFISSIKVNGERTEGRGQRTEVRSQKSIRRLPQYHLPELRGRRRLHGLGKKGQKSEGRKVS